MPATKTRTKPTAADNVSAEIATTISAAVERWRAMVETVADGGPTPPAREILDAAALLGIREPGDALEADAQVLANVRAMQARSDRDFAAYETRLAAAGGKAAIVARIAEVKKTLADLQALIGPGIALCLGHTRGAVVGERGRHPRLFSDAYRGEVAR